MKKFVLTAIMALMLTIGVASAQYAPTVLGTELKYNVKTSVPEVVNKTLTLTLDSIYVEGDRTALRFKNHTELIGSLKTEPDSYSYVYCDLNNPLAPTEEIQLDPNDLKTMLIEQIQEEVSNAGGILSASDLETLNSRIRPSGKLSITLDPTAEADAKIPSTSLRVNLEMTSISFHFSNGKVIGKETITVPAGTFEDCMKITYTLKQNAGPESSKHFATAWYAPGVGMVKQEMKDKRGNEVESQELAAIVTP